MTTSTMADRTRISRIAAILYVVPVYVLLYVVWAGSREFAHTYAHWLEPLDSSVLPRLTAYVLPFIGLERGEPLGALFSNLLWLVAAAWPAVAMMAFYRGSEKRQRPVLALHLVSWIALFLASATVVAIGLWLPFSLL